MQCFMISSIFILILLIGGRAEDSKGTVEDQVEAKAEESLKQELDTMKKAKADRVADPKMFEYATTKLKKALLDKIAATIMPKELKDENIKKTLSPEKLASIKLKYEKDLDRETKQLEKHMDEDFEKNRDEISKLTKEDVEKMIKELDEDLLKMDERIKKEL